MSKGTTFIWKNKKGSTQKMIAESIVVSESTVSRELILEQQWSPSQISGFLRRHEGISISHETKATNIKDHVSIHERPREDDGRRFGDWEMDLIVDRKQNAILTLVERSTSFLLMARQPGGKQAMPVARAVWRLLLYKGEHLHTITTDNGSEFARHKWITRKLNVPVYFTDSYASWQKGAVENANKFVRLYITKDMDISKITDKRIAAIQAKINARPRKKIKF